MNKKALNISRSTAITSSEINSSKPDNNKLNVKWGDSKGFSKPPPSRTKGGPKDLPYFKPLFKTEVEENKTLSLWLDILNEDNIPVH